MNYVNQFLNFISDGLLLPAVTLEILLLVWAVWAMGAFVREFWRRTRETTQPREFLRATSLRDDGNWIEAASRLPEGEFKQAVGELIACRDDKRVAARLINDFESERHRELDRAKLLARLGPMVGLMGTLIPKGHALGQLALGDVSAMTQNLQVAFANTVVGLFIGALGFVIGQGRQRWYKEELDTLDYLYDLLFEKER